MAHIEVLTRRGLRVSIQPDGKIRLEPDWLISDDIRQMVRNNREELTSEITACAVSTDSSSEIVPDYHILMVATNLDCWEADDPRFGYEVMLDVCYRQLDAVYYGWLRHHMENAKNAHSTGRMEDNAFNILRERFNVIHQWAIEHIGQDALKRALRTTNVNTYISPSERTFNAYRATWDAYKRCQVARNQSATPSDQLNYLLATRGYAAVRSSIIDDILIFVRDDPIVVPEALADKVRFTIDELNQLDGSSPEAIKQVYQVKRTFGGNAVPADDYPFEVDHTKAMTPAMSAIQQSLFGDGMAANA